MLGTFLSGAMMMLYLVAALFFAKFWSRTRDRLFLVFSVSFVMLAFERIVLYATGVNDETQSWVYLIRFAAFSLLVLGIVDKNRANSRS